MSSLRFRDPRSTKFTFLDDILVTCPDCGAAAHVVPVPGEPGLMFVPRRLACPGCGLAKTWESNAIALSTTSLAPATHPDFDLPPRLQAQTPPRRLLAYN